MCIFDLGLNLPFKHGIAEEKKTLNKAHALKLSHAQAEGHGRDMALKCVKNSWGCGGHQKVQLCRCV